MTHTSPERACDTCFYIATGKDGVPGTPYCAHPDRKLIFIYGSDRNNERGPDGLCGPSGKHWEPKQ